MKRPWKTGFSVLEVIAAVVILAVVAAATVATVAPMRARSDNWLAEQELATLNALVQSYCRQEGNYPESVTALAEAGFLRNESSEEKARLEIIQQDYQYSPKTGLFSKK